MTDDAIKDKKHENFIMNNQRFLSITYHAGNNIALDNYDEIPQDTHDNIVAFGGWEFKISKLVYPNATAKKILDGWAKLTQDGIPTDMLFLTLFIRTMFDNTCNTEAIKEEPELIELLRLCYWYQICYGIDSQNTLVHKVQEIKEELGKGVRTKMEKYNLPLRSDFDSDLTQYHRELQPVLYAIKQRRAPAGFHDDLEAIRHSSYGFVSECMFYSLANILFNKKKEGAKNPDVYINKVSSEVKPIIDEIQYQDQIEDNLLEEILYSIKRNKLVYKINEALEQRANIVILDATGTSLGYAMNLYTSQHNKTYSVQKSIDIAIELVNSGSKDYVPIIVFAQSIDTEYNFRLSMTMVPCPVTAKKNSILQVDVSKFPTKTND